MSKLERPRAEGLFVNPAYSHTVVATGSRLVYIAGQVAMNSEGQALSGSRNSLSGASMPIR